MSELPKPSPQPSAVTYIVLEEDSCVLLDETNTNTKFKKARGDVGLWILVAIFLAFIIIVCVGFTYMAVNMNKNLGATLISPFSIYPGQFLQNEKFVFRFNYQGILQLTQNDIGVYWESDNLNHYSTYGVVARFNLDGSLSVENYYQQILWSSVPGGETVNSTSAEGSYILHLNASGQVVVRNSQDGTEVMHLPPTPLQNQELEQPQV